MKLDLHEYQQSQLDKKESNSKQGSENDVQGQVEKKRIRKVMNLYQGIDKKFESQHHLKRIGTPALAILDQDMPSQPPHKNSRSVALSHFKCVFDQDPEMTRQQNEEREYKIYKRKIHTKPTDFLEEMH